MTPRGFLKLFSDDYAGSSEHLGYELLMENCFPNAIKNYTNTVYKKMVEIHLEAYDKAFKEFLGEECCRDTLIKKALFDKHFYENATPPKLEDLI